MKRTTVFKGNDFKVKLGSIVNSEARSYYLQNCFSYLVEKLNAVSVPGG